MDDFPFIIMNQLRRSNSYRMPESHTHNTYELYYLLSGTQKFFIQHSVYSMHPHDLALVVPGTLHRTTYSATSKHERIVIMFEQAYIQEILDFFPYIIEEDFNLKPVISVPEDMQEEVDGLFSRLFVEYEKKDEFSVRMISHLLCGLLLLLTRYRKCKEETIIPSSPQDEAISRAAYFISQFYNQPLTLDDAARAASLSATYFSKKFKAVTGFGFKEYLNSIRIQKACKELLRTKDSVTDIALRCGFENSNYFGDLFYKINGVSPRAWRQKHGKV
ncbi:AraC family transcriptional regulator [Murimonas intestini]|uniref:AraC family transcriptional regulator n=1 Tax=Murimonas intestini TaxID=1337051 RepID=UPI0011DD8B64|nr:AraC family transcriptional regulator [Murimonas intestini]